MLHLIYVGSVVIAESKNSFSGASDTVIAAIVALRLRMNDMSSSNNTERK